MKIATIWIIKNMLHSFPPGKWNLFRNTQCKDVNTKQPDFVLSSADTFIDSLTNDFSCALLVWAL